MPQQHRCGAARTGLSYVARGRSLPRRGGWNAVGGAGYRHGVSGQTWHSTLGEAETLTAAPGLRLERTGPLLHLVLDRTDKANALDVAMWEAVPALVAAAEQAPGARMLVLRSATERIFCAGADVAEYRANAGDPSWAMANHTRVTAATDALHASTLVTVAAVSGACAGGGVGLITACDIRIAAPSAVFSVPPTRLGLVYPQPDTARLVDAVGPAAARYLLFTAARVDAQWALQQRLISEIVAEGGLPGRIDAIAAAVAGGAPVSVRAMKETVDMVLAGQRSETDRTKALLAGALHHPDHEEGTSAFLDRRQPVFNS